MRSTLPLFVLALVAAAPAVATEVVPTQPFRSVELRGGGDVTLVPGPVQRVTILNGSSQFTHIYMFRDRQLRIDACNERCPRNYNLQIRIESPSVPTVAVSGGGSINATGGFRQSDVTAAIEGGGTIDLRAVDASVATAAVKGGGAILVRPRSTLTAAVQGGGEVRYLGNPQVTTAVMGGGDVRRID